jgi:hypothetical protein
LAWQLNDDGCTANTKDLVVPGIGEIVGGQPAALNSALTLRDPRAVFLLLISGSVESPMVLMTTNRSVAPIRARGAS